MKKIVSKILLISLAFQAMPSVAQQASPLPLPMASGPTYVWGERIQNHYLWETLGDEAIDRLVELYQSGVRKDVPAGYLRQHGWVGYTIGMVLTGMALSAFGLLVAHDPEVTDPTPGRVVLGLGIAFPLVFPAIQKIGLEKQYRQYAENLEQTLSHLRAQNMEGDALRSALKRTVIDSIAEILSDDKLANRWLDRAPSAKAEDRLESRLTQVLHAALLAPFCVYTSDEFPSVNNPLFEGMRASIRAERKAHAKEQAQLERDARARSEQEKKDARERRAQARRDRHN